MRQTTFDLRIAALGSALTLCACGDDGSPVGDTTSTGTTTGDDTTAGGPTSAGTTTSATAADGSSTGDDGSTGSDTTGTQAKPELGQTPNVLCEAALAQLALIVEENGQADPDPMVIEEAYIGRDGTGTALQDFVQWAGGLLGRVEGAVLIDDEAILDALLGSPSAEDLVDVETRIYLVMSKLVRARIAEVAAAQPDMDRDPALLYADWDEAYCYWDGALRLHAQEADGEGLELEGIEADIQMGFEWGHDGIEGPEASWAIDAWAVPPAKQVVEKSLFRAYDRLVMKHATTAKSSMDSVVARRAWGYFQIIEDRLAGKNTPGIGTIEGHLEGDPMMIDLVDIRTQLSIAFIKRARGYASAAIDSNLVGEAEGFKGATEGHTYAKITLPFMEADLQDFDDSAYLQTWADYAQAVQDGEVQAATTASEELVQWNCAYQEHLGIAECTTDDEPG